MDVIETEGTSVQEATAEALRQLGRREDEVEVEVLSKGSRGFFGLGAKPVRVRVRLKEGGILPPEAIARASQFLARVVKLMGMDVEVEAKHFGNELYLEVDQGAGGILIGRRGATLAALSTLMERIVNHNEDARVQVFVDVAGYLERKRRSLVTMAEDLAKEAKTSGREVPCEPMSAFERKVIHTTLHNNQEVRTFSQGEGSERRVIIAPVPAGQSRQDADAEFRQEAGGREQGTEGDDRGFRRGRGRGRRGWDRGPRGGRGRREPAAGSDQEPAAGPDGLPPGDC